MDEPFLSKYNKTVTHKIQGQNITTILSRCNKLINVQHYNTNLENPLLFKTQNNVSKNQGKESQFYDYLLKNNCYYASMNVYKLN